MSDVAAGQSRRSFLAPFLLFGVTSWFIYHGNYIADESYAYLIVARNLVLHGRQSFSDIFPTNGFQPLWQYLLAGYTWQLAQFKPAWLYEAGYAIPLSAAMLALGTWHFLKIAERLQLSPFWLVYLPAAYLLTFDLLYCEAHAQYAALAVLTRISLDGTLQQRFGPCYAGIAAAAVFLGQLESVGLIFCYSVWLTATTRRWQSTVMYRGVLLALLVPYLVANIVWFDGPLPISRWLAGSFPYRCLKGFHPSGLATTLFGYNVWFGLLPILASGLILLWARTVSRESRHFLLVYLGGCLMQLAYVGVFLRSEASEFRHYVMPMVLAGFALAIAWRTLTVRQGKPGDSPRMAVAGLVLAAALAGIWLGTTIKLRWFPAKTPTQIESTLEYLNDHRIIQAAVFASEFPGHLAWQTPNDIVDAGMRTGYRPLYDRARCAPNALVALAEEYRSVGHPLRVFVYVAGSECLKPDEDLRGVTWYDPRALPDSNPIGSMKFPQGPAVVTRLNGKLYSVIWDLGEEGSGR